MAAISRKIIRQRVHARIRRRLRGTGERPRLAVHFSNRNIYAQVIDDEKGLTIASASTLEAEGSAEKVNIEIATKIGSLVAQRAKAKNIEQVVFDRGGHFFHGKVKALADAAREAGLQF